MGRQQRSAEDCAGQIGGEGGAGSRRLCIATRTERSPDDLIRFVAAPDGSIVPDLSRRLPGRGVWITAEKSVVIAAIKAKAFARSFKRQVNVADDLAETTERLLVKRAVEALSLANKAGLVSTGFDKVDALIAGGKAAALVHGAGAAPGGRQKLDRKFVAVQGDKWLPARIVDWLTIEQLSLATGRSNVVHAALVRGGATERFLTAAERVARYRTGLSAFATAPAPPT